jgi:hypothetical protein
LTPGPGRYRLFPAPAACDAEQPSACGQPPGLPHFLLLQQQLPRRGDAGSADVAHEPGRLLSVNDRQPADLQPRHLCHGLFSQLIGISDGEVSRPGPFHRELGAVRTGQGSHEIASGQETHQLAILGDDGPGVPVADLGIAGGETASHHLHRRLG